MVLCSFFKIFSSIFYFNNSYNVLLPNGKAAAISTDTGTTINPKPVTDKITDVEVAARITIVSTKFKIVVKFL